MSTYTPQRTIHYKTYIKTALVEALSAVFGQHKDTHLKRTKIGIDFPRIEADYPTIIIRLFERKIDNAGVGHEEWIKAEEGDQSGIQAGATFRFGHRFYWGDLEFAIKALSSYDRDLVSDSLVQTIGMGDLESYTNRFFDRIYPDESLNQYPDSIWHYINVNSDTISGFGENQAQTPWMSEDDLIYSVSYRCPVFGEFYSVPPDAPVGLVRRVTQYPYVAGVDPVPTGDPNDGGIWVPPIDFSQASE